MPSLTENRKYWNVRIYIIGINGSELLLLSLFILTWLHVCLDICNWRNYNNNQLRKSVSTFGFFIDNSCLFLLFTKCKWHYLGIGQKKFIIFRWPTFICHFFSPSFYPSVRCAPYLRNRTLSGHNFWYTCVKRWYLQVFFFQFFEIFICGLLVGKMAKNGLKLKIIITSVTCHISGTV